jgi:myo-inositol-1(or 4)-monophosphatase
MLPLLEILVPLIKAAAEDCFKQHCELERTFKDDGSFVTQMDEQLQKDITDRLKQAYPQYTLLGEEMTRGEQQALLDDSASGLWVLDPIDGTTNFSTGFPVYGVSLAFVQSGQTRLAIVYDPVRDECFTAINGEGAWLNENKLTRSEVTELSECIANVDYKRLTGDMASQLVICPPYRSQRNLGSSVIEWCWLAAGRFQVYLHGGQHLWDYAAAQLILSEAGGKASGMNGSAIRVGSGQF